MRRHKPQSPFLRRHYRALLAGIVGLALGLRTIHLLEIRNGPLFLRLQTDAFEYQQWAARIVEGDWLGRHDPVFYQGPLYPYVLALVYRLAGPSTLAACVVQILLSATSVGLVVHLGRRYFGRAVGLLGGLLVAAYGMLIFYTGLLLAETLIVFCHLLLLVALESALRRGGSWRWAASGALLGVAAVARANVLLFAPLAAVVVVAHFGVRQGRRWLPPLAIAALGLVIAIAPVTLHNRVLGDDTVLLSWNGGINLFIGNNANSDGIYLREARYRGRAMGLSVHDQLTTFPEVARQELAREELKPSEISGFWVDRSLDEIAAAPGQWLGLLANKLHYYLNAYEVPNVRNYYFSKRFSALLRLPLVSFGLILPFALVGLVLCRETLRRHGLLVAYVAAHLAALLAFFVNDRYRLVVVPVLCLFAAHALRWMVVKLRHKDYARFGIAAGGALLAFVLGYSPVTETSFRADLLNLGNAYRDLGQLERAVESYDEAIALSNDFHYAYFKKAEVLSRLGRKDEAVSAAETALSLAQAHGDGLNAKRIRALLTDLGVKGRSSGAGSRSTAQQCGQGT